jgi:hypothetical protein
MMGTDSIHWGDRYALADRHTVRSLSLGDRSDPSNGEKVAGPNEKPLVPQKEEEKQRDQSESVQKKA